MLQPFARRPHHGLYHPGKGRYRAHGGLSQCAGKRSGPFDSSSWNLQEKAVHAVRVRVFCNDKKGLLAEISSALAASEVNILRADLQTTEDKKAVFNFELEVHDLKHLQNAFRSMSKLKNVLKVERLRGLPTTENEGKEDEA